MVRSFKKGLFVDEYLFKKVDVILEGKMLKKLIKIWLRRLIIFLSFIGLIF